VSSELNLSKKITID